MALAALAVMAVFYQEGRIRGLQRVVGTEEPASPDLNEEAEHLDIQDRIDALEARLDQLQSVAQARVEPIAVPEEAVREQIREVLDNEKQATDAKEEERLATRRQDLNRARVSELTVELRLTATQGERLLAALNHQDDEMRALISTLSAHTLNDADADARIERIQEQFEQDVAAILDARQIELFKASRSKRD